MKFLEICKLVSDRDGLLEYCFSVGLVRNTGCCDSCDTRLSLQGDSRSLDGVVLRCPKCKRRVSVRSSTFVGDSKLSLSTVISILYLLKLDVVNSKIAEILGIGEEAVGRLAGRLREHCSKQLAEINEKLGGEGVVVQVDESLLSKSKLTVNRHARPMSEKWVLGMYDTEKRYGIYGSSLTEPGRLCVLSLRNVVCLVP